MFGAVTLIAHIPFCVGLKTVAFYTEYTEFRALISYISSSPDLTLILFEFELSMPPKKRASSTRSATKAKRSRPNVDTPAQVLSQAIEVPASEGTVQEIVSSSQPATQSAGTPQSHTGSLDIPSLVTTITTSVLKGLQAAGICNNPTSTSQPLRPSAEVNAARDEDVANITGLSGVTINSSLGSQEAPTPNQGGTFHSIAINLGSRVPDKIKHKIWADQYIDLGLLLSSSTVEPTKYSVSVCTDSDHANGLGKLSLEPIQKPKRIASFGQWASAFNTFVAVYTVSFPTSAPALMKYCEIVRDLANKQGNWRWYDEQFRFLRQSEPKSFPWDNVHWELWFQSLPISQSSARLTLAHNPVKSRAAVSAPFPKGFCWKFASGEFCGGCKFKHSCHKCSGSHRASECTSSNFRPKPQRPVGGKTDAAVSNKPSPTHSAASNSSKG